jgi:5'-3' exonuclease
MGIPAYFSHIIKNYPKIIQRFQKKSTVNHLYLDSNSIVYDAMRSIEYSGNNDDYERKLINAVCKKIETYIQQISPSHLLFIAFDGVAPVAKLDQQKNRRYKSWFTNQYDKTDNPVWNSTAITPGTDFMNKLNLQVRYHFRKPSSYNVKKIIISGSDFPGEGEHKIFEYIRENTKELEKLLDEYLRFGPTP